MLLAPLGALAVIAALLHEGLPSRPRGAPSPLVGKAAPRFDLPQVHDAGRWVSTDSMRGRVWVLNVWASWCAPCREEHPLLVAVARDAPVTIIGLNHQDDPRSAQEWLRKLGDPYHATASDSDGSAGSAWGVQGVPQTFVIDAEGIVRLRHAGPLTRAVWEGQVLPLVRELRG